MAGRKQFVGGIVSSLMFAGLALFGAGCDTLNSTGVANAVVGNVGNNNPEDDVIQTDESATENNPGDKASGEDSRLFAALADKFFSFGNSSFFSSGSITENVELQPCAFGQFGMRITRITSTSIDTFSSEEILQGTWSVLGNALILNIENAGDPADIGTQRQFAVEIDGSGDVFFDGTLANAFDAAADCAAAQ